MGALPANWETTTVAETLIGTDLDLALDILRDLASQITFNGQIGIDVLTDLHDLTIGEVTNLRAPIDIEIIENLMRGPITHPKNVGETNLDTLVSWKVGSGNTSH
jgi:hypothetical protein